MFLPQHETDGCPKVVALLTDYGLADPYVGQMKAVLTACLPGVALVDLTHGVPPHNVLAGAFFLDASLPWMPPGSVTVAVVDPGVGTSRRIVGLRRKGRLVLAPDNGLLTLLLLRGTMDGAWAFPVPETASATFHGRDVFAPLAAALAGGRPVLECGYEVDPASLVLLPGLNPTLEGGRLQAKVLHVDRFGNLILNLRITEYEQVVRDAAGVSMELPGAPRIVRAAAYAAVPPGALGLLAGSQGHFELAMNRESAARETGLEPGDAVTLYLADKPTEEPDKALPLASER
ncbi:SAM-dependent chlorinase/fluorinase [Desulfovibrio sulfodismutans]|uniref:SAM-dependent chlorinase/fluorinase n=1 Tax=Desulfolutivibrio sulfodismutans TaxID=63561 RepID=A0A7K3NIT5_9BACT|nr:SAM-dependent chlorinase/fluorinase [Desulfolutivibrio sulfodismutans]NDY56104.1 SAM-dependent chlorinase/fluorinase [Desulfolutivibrio sulfodismutans]QLA13158.1 hypothetical protein GD606_13215 [Desulfolutivibrio sulfodismutans DSM 3696]